jgi:hypothetical protein
MKSPSLSPEEILVLSDFDDDAYGLWEEVGRRDELIEVLINAAERRHIAVFSGPFGERGEMLPADAAVEAIRASDSWTFKEPPQRVVTIMSTDEGRIALKEWVDENGFPCRS